MGIIAWIILGGFAGWIASMIMNTDKDQGIFLNIIVGIVGAILGGFLIQLTGSGINFDFDIQSFLVAILGAVVLLAIYKLVTGKR